MKRKVVTLVEEKVIKLAKRRAVRESRPLSCLIQDALVAYLSKKRPDRKRYEEAYKRFCERSIRISRDQFNQIPKEDAWGQ